jgi:hypothetical protein
VENINVTDIVSGHQDYCLYAGEILRRVRLGQPFRSDGSLAELLVVPDAATESFPTPTS